MKLKLVCISTHSEGYFPALQQSCRKHNIKLNILGWGQKWKGLIWKFHLLMEFLKTSDPDDIILHADAHDVILLENEEQILAKYKSFNKPIVLGIENPMNYNFMTALRNSICEKCDDKHIINTGLYIGKASKLIEMLGEICTYNDCSCDKNNCDQVLLNKFCNQTDFIKKNTAKDEKGLLFFNASCSTIFSCFRESCDIGLEMINNKLINPLTGIQPSFLHGPFQINLNKYVEYLGLPICPKIKSRFLWAIKSYKKYIFYYLIRIILIIVVIVIVVYFFKN